MRICEHAPPRPAETSTPTAPDPTTHLASVDLSITTTPPLAASDAPPTHALTSNRSFLTSIPPDSLSLQEVHSAALPSIPAAASAAIDAVFIVALNALLSNINDDAACTLLYAATRLLLYPPPPTEQRSALPATLQSRARQLRLGNASALWLAHDWNTHRAVDTTIHTIHPDRLPSIINHHISADSPARAFHRIYTIPFAPPAPSVAPLVLAKVPTAPNSDLDLTSALPIAAADLLPTISPSSPRSARIFDATDREAVISSWSKAVKAHPSGAPDGTGLRTCYISSTEVLPLIALLLDAIRRGLISPAHRRLLTTKTTSGQLKKLDDGTYPTTVAAIIAVRPLCRHNLIRRHLARRIARAVTHHRRAFLESLGQYGNSPSGCDTAVHRMQLLAERYPHLIHHLIDIVNAHTSIARHAVLTALDDRVHSPDATQADVDALTYFLLFYSTAGPTLVQSVRDFLCYLQTDGLDQGCGIAGYAFNLTFSIAVHRALLSIQPPRPHPALPLPVLIHDDTTLPLPPTIQGSSEPFYPIAIAAITSHLLDHLRLRIAPQKSVHFQMPLPPSHTLHISHTFPHLHSPLQYRLAVGARSAP